MMLPDPKKVAQVLKNTVLKNKAQRQQERELERDVRVRMAKTRLKRHVTHQREMLVRLKGLAKRALSLNDEARFRQVGKQMLSTRRDIARWEKYLLSMEILETRRDQVRASADLLEAVRTMSESLADVVEPKDMSELQVELERGLAKAGSMDERMEVMMEMMDSALDADAVGDEASLADLESELMGEISRQESADFDQEIEKGLNQIRSELEDK